MATSFYLYLFRFSFCSTDSIGVLAVAECWGATVTEYGRRFTTVRLIEKSQIYLSIFICIYSHNIYVYIYINN